MGVPTSGPYKMFDTGSAQEPLTTSIRGAQLHEALDPVSGDNAVTFKESKNRATLSKFDPRYLGDNITELSQVIKSSQFKGYPVPPEDIVCYDASATEVDYPILNCVTWAIHKLDPLAEGLVRYGSSTPAESIKACTNSGTTISGILHSTGSNTTFVGWSLSPSEDDIISTSLFYSVTMEDYDSYIFAIIRLSDSVAIDTCYYPVGTGQTTRCTSCNNTTTVYFDRDEYFTTALEDLTWYSNPDLSTFAPNGYYRTYITLGTWWGSSIKLINQLNYLITGSDGDAHAHSVCDGDFIYCS
tara:strand:+ start:480 stop:1376 length:897 start_codon:yes stop_codon:yes gene_type:complete